ncbi:MAG: Trp family transcriptional regulator [Flammeovirgaceae bacterium]
MEHPLYTAIQHIKSQEEFMELLEITLTDKEREMILERWRIFKAIDEGKSQREVAKAVGCSVATATRGAKAYRKFGKRVKYWLSVMFTKS